MAGLLDIFGTSGQETLGLLGGDVGRSRDDAQAQALYALAGSLLSGGPTGLSIVKGLQQGQQAYRQAMRGSLEEQMQGVQMQEMLRKRKQEEEALRRQQMIDAAVARAYQPGVAAQPAQEIYGEDIMGQQVGEGMTPAVAAQAPRLDLQSIAPALMASREGRATLADLMKAQEVMQPKLQTLAEGAKLGYMQDGKFVEVAAGMPKPESVPSAIKEYQFAVSQGYTGSFDQYQKEQKRAGATSINMPTGEERKAAVLANRMNFGVAQMNEAIGQSPSAAMPNTAAEAARFFTKSDFLANKLTPEQRQVVESAQLDVLDAALTLGTGAAYTREQLDGYRKSYFPQLGDTDANVKTKQKRLENLLKSAEIASGRAAGTIPTKAPASFEMPTGVTEVPSGVKVRKRGE